MNPKQIIGEKATGYIKNGMTVGLGSGSTAYWAIKKIGQLVREGLLIRGVPTSENTEKLAIAEGIPLTNIADVEQIDLTIDGADEFDPEKNVIKGGGGALLREKIVASLTDYYIIIADYSKSSEILGNYPVPVEVTPFAWEVSRRQLEKLGCKATIREANGTPYITDNQNYILDCLFGRIEKPDQLAVKINRIPGVVENGLFLNMADILITTDKKGEILILE